LRQFVSILAFVVGFVCLLIAVEMNVTPGFGPPVESPSFQDGSPGDQGIPDHWSLDDLFSAGFVA
jgi:hypothetical protein